MERRVASGAFVMLVLRRCGLIAASLAMSMAALIGVGGGQALASTGCTAINGGALDLAYLRGNSLPAVNANLAAVTFDAGEIITLSVSGAAGITLDPGQTLTLTIGGVTQTVAAPAGASSPNLAGTVLTITAIGTETTGATHLGVYTSDGPGIISVTCAPPNANAQKNANLQKMLQAAQVGAQNSGTAISGAIGAAVGEAFDDSCSAFTPLQNGMRFNVNGLSDRDPACFDDNNRSSTTSRFAPETFDANAYASKRRMPASDALLAFDTKAPVKRKPQEWRVWIDVRGSHLDTSGAVGDLRGDQVNVLAGLTRKFSRDLVAGIFGGYEDFNFTSQAVSGKLRGEGGTVGSYLGWRIMNGVRFDAGFAYSKIGYNAAANQGLATAVTASLNGDRWLATAGLTGDYVWNAYTFEPSARVYWLTEHESAFADSLGTLNAARNFGTGRASVGDKLIFPASVVSSTFAVAPYAGLYGDYYFTSDDTSAVLTQNGLTSITLKGFSGRAIAGLTGKTTSGVQMVLGGEYGGLGSDIHVWTYRARVGVPF